jgi:hypothetical protein
MMCQKQVRLDAIAALQKGKWDNDAQDWLAVVVTNHGGEITTNTLLRNAVVRIESQLSREPRPVFIEM